MITAATGGGWPPDFGDWTNADWSTFATCLAVFVAIAAAIAAAIVGWRQLQEARRLRAEQAQPYVVAFMDDTPGHGRFVDLVVRNFGTTAAYDVRISADPVLQRSKQGGGSEDVWLPARIPVLVPGQEWRTWWDFMPSRVKAGLTKSHSVTVTYKDSKGTDLTPSESLLDWSQYDQRHYVDTKGVHEVAKTLEEIAKTMSRWGEGLHGLTVFTRDGDDKDEAEREYLEKWNEQHSEKQQDD